MVEVFKALGDENRLRLINLLSIKPLCVCELEVILDMSQSNVSRHLKKLKDNNIIDSKKEAQWVYYKLDDSFINGNNSLINYLKSTFNTSEIFKDDRKKYNLYSENGLNCQSLKDDKNRIINIINK